MNSKTIFVDMDGVLCNFVKRACEIYNREDAIENFIDPQESLNLSNKDFWEGLNKEQDDGEFWEKLEKYEWADALVDYLNNTGVNWYILTSPSINPNSASGKVGWLQRSFGKHFKNYFITKYKYLLATPDRILIDDTDIKCEDFEKWGGKTILFPQGWNKNKQYKSDPLEFTKEKINQFKED